MKLHSLDRAAIAILLGQLGLGLYVYAFGKLGPLPTHFGLNGQVDGWGDRTQVAALILALTAGSGLAYALLPALARGRAASANGTGMTYARGTLLAVGVAAVLLMTLIGVGVRAVGAPDQVERMVMGFMALIMLGVGAMVGKVGPNPFVGVRTFWALRSRLAWDRSNRLLGRLWFWFGLAALFATPLAPQPAGNFAVLGGMMITTTAAIVESWRVWRTDPDRSIG